MDEPYVITCHEHNSQRRTRPCSEGRQHRYGETYSCVHCGDPRGDFVNCWFFNCGPAADEWYERWVVNYPSFHDLLKGAPITQRLQRDFGTCNWCMERHRRVDQADAIRGQRDIYEAHSFAASVRRREARDAIRTERERQWQSERAARTERRRQRDLLRQGHRTLTELRKHLRSPGQSPQPESRPARTSPTS